MPFKSKEDRAEYMRRYREKKKHEQHEIALRKKNRIADLNFKKLSGNITNTEYRELLNLESKYYPAEKEQFEPDSWGDLFITPEIKAETEARERAERERDPSLPPDPEASPDLEEYRFPLRYGRDSEKTIYVDLNGEPIVEKKKKSPDHWRLFDWIE